MTNYIATSRSKFSGRAKYDNPPGGEGCQPVAEIQGSDLTGFLLLV